MPALVMVLINGLVGFWMVRKGAILAMVATAGLFVTGVQSELETYIWGRMNALSPDFYAVIDLLGVPEVITVFFWAMSFAFYWWAFRKASGLI